MLIMIVVWFVCLFAFPPLAVVLGIFWAVMLLFRSESHE